MVLLSELFVGFFKTGVLQIAHTQSIAACLVHISGPDAF